MKTDVQSRTIDVARFPLMLLIIAIHMDGFYGPVGPAPSTIASYSDLYTLCHIVLCSVLPSIALPTFFLFSGYLFFYHFEVWSWRKYADKLKRRVRTLLIPYLVWNVIVMVMKLVRLCVEQGVSWGTWEAYTAWITQRGGLLSMLWCSRVVGHHVDVLGNSFVQTAPICTPLWYLRDLMVIMVLAPLVYALLRRKPLIGLLLLGVCDYCNLWIHLSGVTAFSALYFSLGAAFAIHGRNMIEDLARYRRASIWVAIPFFIAHTLSYDHDYVWAEYLNTLPRNLLLIAFLNITSWAVARGLALPEICSKANFFIYAAHTVNLFVVYSPIMLVLYACGWMDRVTPIDMRIVGMLITPLLTAALCIGLYWLLRRLLPRFTAVITGNR